MRKICTECERQWKCGINLEIGVDRGELAVINCEQLEITNSEGLNIMVDYIVGGIVVAVIGLAVRYIYKQKKNGSKCIGCPYCKNCSSKCSH